MGKTVARLVRQAFEPLGIRHTFGIPGIAWYVFNGGDQLHIAEAQEMPCR